MVEEFDVIDAAGLAPDGRVGLMMFEHRNWSDPELQLHDLHKKTQAYLSYAVDGEMVRDNPQFADRQVWVRLVAQIIPPSPLYPYLAQLKSALAKHGIEFQLAHFDPSDESTGVNNLIAI
ncbi:DUF6572 domain-containing protein [Xanthomonas sp. NCPPB 2865]|uniref:DUF6572 domain-containing protein n=1 Tax=Xanthomonas TaxID=338 RepID=UPI00160C9450|nr:MULTISPECIES: DUF6572 domain-containing protein [Xanthomonas]MBB5858796.1 hypothetical protein [Xanthomonas arboricola]